MTVKRYEIESTWVNEPYRTSGVEMVLASDYDASQARIAALEEVQDSYRDDLMEAWAEIARWKEKYDSLVMEGDASPECDASP
jgi:hypothetical protein